MDTKAPVNILIAPLDWGIGHATRCVPIIRYLLERGYVPVLASSGKSKAFLEKEFPQLTCLHLPAYNVTYAGRGKLMAFKMLIQIPKILRAINREHRQLKEIIKAHNIRLIISDNRYGLWHQSVPSVFITHQLMVKMPGLLKFSESLNNMIIKGYLCKFSRCFIPDYEGSDNLSGDLSHKYKPMHNTSFIGPLSRFGAGYDDKPLKTYDILFMLSGPEPQRSIFEGIILSQIKNTSQKMAILRGLPDSNTHFKAPANVDVFSHLPSSEIEALIKASRLVVARAGYSTIMDLTVLNAKAILVPTPGQTEQMYLAQYHHEKGHFMSAFQDKFVFIDVLKKMAVFPFKPFVPKGKKAALKPAFEHLIDSFL